MRRTSFLSLTAIALAAIPLAARPAPGLMAAGRIDSVAHRSLLVGASGACASRRARRAVGGYTLADVV